jgi:hypothetical protein
MQVFRENQEEVLGEIFALRNNQQVEIKYLNLEAADAVRRW